MFYYGNVRTGDPYLNPGCGFPLYTQISWKYYGILDAYYYGAKGLMWSFLSNQYYPYEISPFGDLQKLYNHHQLVINLSNLS